MRFKRMAVFIFLKLKIVSGIIITDSFDDLLQIFVIIRILSILYTVADETAENSSEILVSWIGNKASGIRKLSHKSSQHSQIGQCFHLLFHTVFIVIEPPAGTKLDLAFIRSFLEIAKHCAKNIIILGIQGI